MSPEECRIEIQQNIGIMYDPKIAEMVLNNWGKIIKNENEKDLILDYSI